MKVKLSGESIVSEGAGIKIAKDGFTTTKTEKSSIIPSYRDQWNRLKRSYQRLKEMDEGRAYSIHSENYQDEIYTFFMNCYHLKDWLKRDLKFRAHNEVEDYVKLNEALLVCADICNAHKHFHLDNPRSGKEPKVGSLNVESKLKVREVSVQVKFIIDSATGPMDGFELEYFLFNLA